MQSSLGPKLALCALVLNPYTLGYLIPGTVTSFVMLDQISTQRRLELDQLEQVHSALQKMRDARTQDAFPEPLLPPDKQSQPVASAEDTVAMR